MSDVIMELLIAGRIPGTQTFINYEAFLEGLLAGCLTLLVIRLVFAATNRKNKQLSPKQEARLRTIKV